MASGEHRRDQRSTPALARLRVDPAHRAGVVRNRERDACIRRGRRDTADVRRPFRGRSRRRLPLAQAARRPRGGDLGDRRASKYSRQGAGRTLLAAAEAYLSATAVEFLQVKTLGPSDPSEEYARTRAFYEAMGFVPLEELLDLGVGQSVPAPREEAAVERAPARRAAYDVLRRVFEDDAYADRALRSASEGLDDRIARSPDNSRSEPCSACVRSTTRSRRSGSGRPQARPAGPRSAPPGRVPARLSRRRPDVRGCERVGRARPRGAARARRALHERGAAARRRRHRAATRTATGGAAEALLPGLDLGRLAPRPRRGGGARAHARSERACTARRQTRPGTDPGRVRDGHPGRMGGAAGRRGRARGRTGLATEQGLAARRPRRRLARG